MKPKYFVLCAGLLFAAKPLSASPASDIRSLLSYGWEKAKANTRRRPTQVGVVIGKATYIFNLKSSKPQQMLQNSELETAGIAGDWAEVTCIEYVMHGDAHVTSYILKRKGQSWEAKFKLDESTSSDGYKNLRLASVPYALVSKMPATRLDDLRFDSEYRSNARLAPLTFALSGTLTDKKIAGFLGYLVDAPNFSKSKPLTQAQLMNIVLGTAWWGLFPRDFHGTRHQAIEGCDAYITRPMVRRFVRELTGQNLTLWSAMGETRKPLLHGERLGWWYNSSNTMYARPSMRIDSKRRLSSSELAVTFTLLHQPGNLSNEAPVEVTGTGMAVLSRRGKNWVATSWQLKRKDSGVSNQTVASSSADAMKQFVNALSTQNTKVVLSMISSQGLTHRGPDFNSKTEPLPETIYNKWTKAEIRVAFEKRTGIWNWLLGHNPNQYEGVPTMRDLVLRSRGRAWVQKGDLFYEPRARANEEFPVYFAWKLENGRWVLDYLFQFTP